MGALKISVIVVASILFLISGLIASTSLVFRNSVSYENIQFVLSSQLSSILEDPDFEYDFSETFLKMQEYCENNSEYIFFEENINEVFEIDCSVIEEGEIAVKEKVIGDLLDKIYYEDYDCGFWDCFGETGSPMFLFSQKTYDYFGRVFYFSLISLAVLFGILFLFVSGKSNAFIIAGILLPVSAVHLLFFSWVFEFVPYIKEFSFLFASASGVFWRFVIFGAVFLVVGFLIKLFSVGFKISDFFQKSDKKKEKLKKPEESKKQD